MNISNGNKNFGQKTNNLLTNKLLNIIRLVLFKLFYFNNKLPKCLIINYNLNNI